MSTLLKYVRFRYVMMAMVVMAAVVGLGACKSVKLSDADAQFERGEYNDASKTYRKIYNRLTKREERPLCPESKAALDEMTQILADNPNVTLVPDAQESADQINRRTEFEVTSITYGISITYSYTLWMIINQAST